MSDADRTALYEQEARRIPLGRIGEVDDAARAYVYCMEQTYGTGTVLTVEGGTLLV
jgi:NAD(P)-dependent dehydrogenase (short-subunit alcohol dehydrogenase family)